MRFPVKAGAIRYRSGALLAGSEPVDSRGASLMLDVLFVGVTILVFAVLALIAKAVEKL
ncbi:hypothetical protein EDD99_3281 [Streptomyces sp. 846.5]|nr:hypothetical protein [Streptomyces sp. 846.5]TDU04806.1 hypothetical protein EDD99_3281 [Streptomyces sp. 846.5]